MKYENYVSIVLNDAQQYVVYFTCNSASLATKIYNLTETTTMLAHIFNWMRNNIKPS